MRERKTKHNGQSVWQLALLLAGERIAALSQPAGRRPPPPPTKTAELVIAIRLLLFLLRHIS
jgi:hypothetical protein